MPGAIFPITTFRGVLGLLVGLFSEELTTGEWLDCSTLCSSLSSTSLALQWEQPSTLSVIDPHTHLFFVSCSLSSETSLVLWLGVPKVLTSAVLSLLTSAVLLLLTSAVLLLLTSVAVSSISVVMMLGVVVDG